MISPNGGRSTDWPTTSVLHTGVATADQIY